eukprot:6180306-Pleurochrysis_carterae.AAC.1
MGLAALRDRRRRRTGRSAAPHVACCACASEARRRQLAAAPRRLCSALPSGDPPYLPQSYRSHSRRDHRTASDRIDSARRGIERNVSCSFLALENSCGGCATPRGATTRPSARAVPHTISRTAPRSV